MVSRSGPRTRNSSGRTRAHNYPRPGKSTVSPAGITRRSPHTIGPPRKPQRSCLTVALRPTRRRGRGGGERLTSCMEGGNLETAEKAGELSRLNNRLYECGLPEEARTQQDNVVSHVIIKSDVRGSTRMTQDLLSRGLSPASHFSLNSHEPVKKLLDRYSAKKVFIEGDAIILAISETESTVAYARPVATACILSRQILAVYNSYNERASASDLPALELGLGVAFQGSAPTYWTDGDSRIMISKALNLSDRPSRCAKLANRMLA